MSATPNGKNNLNKELILREKLAVERTKMAIDRTLLSFIRTALYFAIAGMTVNSLMKLSYGWWIEIVFWSIAVLTLLIGIVKYRDQQRKLKESEKHIGSYLLEFEEELNGD
jgi:putative membrane protein